MSDLEWREDLLLLLDRYRRRLQLLMATPAQRRLPLHRQRAVRRALRVLDTAVLIEHTQVNEVLDGLRGLEKRFGAAAVHAALPLHRRYRQSCELSEYGARADDHIRAVGRMGSDLRVPSRWGIRTRVVAAEPLMNRPDLDAEGIGPVTR